MTEKGAAILSEFQPSMTEWLAAIGEEKESALFRKEDNTKDDRLEILYQTIGLPYERPTNFPAEALVEKTPEFVKFLAEHGSDLCALRLIPTRPELPKLRNRGLSVRDVCETWFPKQDIDPLLYTASFRPHADDYDWSLILVVSSEGAFGEMIPGQHAQLTHGDTKARATRFRTTDFKTLEWQNEQPGAAEVVGRALAHVFVPDQTTQDALNARLEVQFAQGHLVGYFEGVLWPDGVLRFSDYNRLLGASVLMPGPFVGKAPEALSGSPAYRGKVEGVARIVTPENITTVNFAQGDVLVSDNTDIRFVGLMQKAGAIVTARGGMLSHASIVARELKKPTVVGVAGATSAIADGDVVEVDADAGVIKILKKHAA